jgi:hypothetical protein
MTITARVENLSSSMQATGVLEDMASGVYMASGEKSATLGSHAFILNGRVYDSNGTDGTTTATFNIFGRCPTSMNHCDLYIDFILTDGTRFPRESFDAANMIMAMPNSLPPAERIFVGESDNLPDHLIELPADMNTGVVIDEWDKIVIPVK